jgi:hypothetical protein
MGEGTSEIQPVAKRSGLPVLLAEFIHRRCAGDELVERGGHVGAIACGVRVRAVQRVCQEGLRTPGLFDELVELVDLLADRVAPLLTRCVEDGRGDLQGYVEALRDFDQRQSAQLILAVDAASSLTCPGGNQAALVVVTQGRRIEAYPGSCLTDRDEVHSSI